MQRARAGDVRRLVIGPLAADRAAATVIQARRRIRETALTEAQAPVRQVPIPEPRRFLEPRETGIRRMTG